MNAMSIPRDSRTAGSGSRPPPGNEGRGRPESHEPPEHKRPRTFLCRDDLFRAFVERADSLECSVDWLLAEAMKRLLKETAPAPVTSPLPRVGGPRLLPPPPPPPKRRQTGSFIGEVSRPVPKRIALRLHGAAFVVDADRFVLGRSARDANLPLKDGGVSRQHAIIERDASGAHTIVDMASTNGVRVNGARVTRAPIRPGDVLEIGPFEIRVEEA